MMGPETTDKLLNVNIPFQSNGHRSSGEELRVADNSFQIVVPVYNEGENVLRLYEELLAAKADFDKLTFVYDFEGDTTLPHIAKLRSGDSRVNTEKNEFGRGVLNALRWGFAHCGGGPVVVVMGDCSDKLTLLPEMITHWERGATIVSPSRYMPGGKQFGGGLVKSTLSRVACTSLRLLGFPTADATNNFKLYDGNWLRAQSIESTGGFEVALELCCKAFEQRRTIVELPTEWRDRTDGESKFQLLRWLPRYLRWYFKILAVLFERHTEKFKNFIRSSSAKQ